MNTTTQTSAQPTVQSSTSGHVLGIDIGGTKLAVAVSDRQGRILAQGRIPTNSSEGHEKGLVRLVELCRKVIGESGGAIEAAGIGSVGPMDLKNGTIVNPVNLPGWKVAPLVATVREALQIPVYLDNDANAAALGEHRFGAGRGVDNMIYMTISTGIGGGVIVNGRLYAGENGNAGEIGHMSIDYRGRPCNCGNVGCIERYASGTAIAARAREAIKTAGAGEGAMLLSLAGAEKVTSATVVEAARRNDPLAKRLWDDTILALGTCMANAIHIFNPRRIVLGGGVTHAGDLLFVPLREQTKKRTLAKIFEVVEIVPAQLGENVGVLGAAAVGMAAIE